MNFSDSEIVYSILKNAGFEQTSTVDEADVVLLNTCAIRDHAESKIWKRLEGKIQIFTLINSKWIILINLSKKKNYEQLKRRQKNYTQLEFSDVWQRD